MAILVVMSKTVVRVACLGVAVSVAQPLNASLGVVINFLVQISNFSLAICSGFSAI